MIPGTLLKFDPGAIFVAILVVCLIAGAIWRIVQHYQERSQPGFADPEELFRELCAAHQLDGPTVGLLADLAAEHRIEPGTLFVEPGRFSPEHFGPKLLDKQIDLALLHEKLFS
jgi:hypothetical protein